MRRLTCDHRSGAALLLALLPALCGADATPQSDRERAATLFDEGRRMEALPLLEDQVEANPRDDRMLVALAACLVEHAATVNDVQAAGAERLRARDLLDRARALGNNSTLAMNLSQLLQGLPQDGTVAFSDNNAVEQAMREGEAAFFRREFQVAIGDYSKALQLDPKNYTAALFIANSYDREDNFVIGAQWYERAIPLGPDIETAYRYYADMLAREGDMAAARAMLIHAAVAEPYNRIVWRELRAWAQLNRTHIEEIFIAVPAPAQNQPAGFKQPSEISAVWLAYRNAKRDWQPGGKQFGRHFPAEKQYRHSLPEEAEALTAAARLLQNLTAQEATAALVRDDANATLLLRLYQAGLVEPYVLFSLGDREIAADYPDYRTKNRAKLEAYLSTFVVPQL
jgi:tetratricopeptide (TPR) repeat protein